MRREGDQAKLTIKGANQGISRVEYEYAIPTDDADAMLRALCEQPTIAKTRYVVEHAGKRWEVDVFAGDNAGLVIAELELASEDEAFDKPAWIAGEVSDDPRYYNANLVKHPYKDWIRVRRGAGIERRETARSASTSSRTRAGIDGRAADDAALTTPSWTWRSRTSSGHPSPLDELLRVVAARHRRPPRLDSVRRRASSPHRPDCRPRRAASTACLPRPLHADIDGAFVEEASTERSPCVNRPRQRVASPRARKRRR